MVDEHWFDALNKALVRDTPRRTVLGAAGALVAHVALAGPVVQAAKNRKKKNRKRTRKKRGRPKPAPSCSCEEGEVCCGLVCCGPTETSTCCQSFNGPSRVFTCIERRVDCCVDDPVGWCDPDTAVCCPGVGCCEGTCCQSFNGPSRVSVCVGRTVECCADDPVGYCEPGDTCCPGVGCVTGACPAPGGQCGETCLTYPNLRCCDGDCVNIIVNQAHCGGCNQTCFGPNLRCCGGDCVDLMNDLDNCGACGLSCDGPPGPGVWTCCDGDCKALHNDEENCGACGETCIGPGLACCSSTCVNTLTDADHCGRCGNREPDYLCCGGYLYDPDLQFCCHATAGPPCFNGQICCLTDEGLPACCNPPDWRNDSTAHGHAAAEFDPKTGTAGPQSVGARRITIGGHR